MFDRFVRLTQAKRALQKRQFEQALGLLEDPLVRSHRRAELIRDAALHVDTYDCLIRYSVE